MGDSKEYGRVLYYDPNGVKVGGVNENSIFNRDLTKSPEDLSIAVDLQVVTKNRGSVYSEGNGTVTTWSLIGGNTKINFLNGTNLDNFKNTNVLTDFFSNLGDKKDGLVENLPEALCVNSIDIEFNSWYAASVIINFTDVRGAALFSSSDYVDYLKDNNQPVNNNYESFYKTFFTFPYPMYKLKIKGFYGDAVTYPLHCSDFKAQFNASTGNFDVTVNFVGYTHAMLNDLEMPYLIAAPYCEYEGKNYWESQIKNGRFLSSEGTPLPTFYELLVRIKNGEYKVNKLSTSELKTDADKYTIEIDSAKNIFNEIRSYLNSVKQTIGGLFKENSHYCLINIDKNKPLTDSLFKTIENIDKSILEFKNTFNKSILFEKYSVDDLKLKIDADGNYKTIDLDKLYFDFTTYELEIKNNIKNNLNELEFKSNNTLNEVYGMVGNIYNYFKVLIAHMETFYHMIETCSKNIPKDRGFGKIPVGYTDGNVSKDKNDKPILSPFPWVTKNAKYGRLEDEWIGNYDSNLEEVTFIESLIKAKESIQKQIQQLNNTQIVEPNSPSTTDGGLTIGSVWIPIHPFDNSISLIGAKNYLPWEKDINKTSEKNLMIYDRAYLRTLIPTLFTEAVNSNVGKLYGAAEAYNIYDQIKGDIKLGAQIQTAIKELDGSLPFNSLKGGKYNEGTFNKYNSLETKSELDYVYIPFFEDDPSVHRAFSTNEKETGKAIGQKKLWYYNYVTRPAYNQKISDDRYKGQKPFVIVNNGYKNTYPDRIYTEYYAPLKDKLIKLNNTGVNGIVNILKNYNFVDNKNEHITYAYFNSRENEKTIENKICKKRVIYNKPTFTKDEGNYEIFNSVGYKTNINKYNTEFIFNNLYKLYSDTDGSFKTDIELKKVYNKLTESEKDDFLKNYTYPFIGGKQEINLTTTSEEYVFSLFGHKFYYTQRQQTGYTATHSTAYLFLSTLNIDINGIESAILNFSNKEVNLNNQYNINAYMTRIPRVGILLIGGLLWRHSVGKKTFFNVKGVTLPETNEYFRKNNGLYLSYKNEYDKSILFYEQKNDDETIYTPILDWKETEFFINEFKQFVDNEWDKIRVNFELINKNNNSLTAFSLNDISNKIETIENDKTLNYIEKNDNVLSLFKKNSSIDNYVNIRKNKFFYPNNLIIEDEDGVNLFNKSLTLINKDGTGGVINILKLLLEDCILTYSGNVQGVNHSDQINSQKFILSKTNSVLAELLKNKNYASELGLNNSLSNGNGKVDIESVDYNEDLRLSTYTYIKTLYDKWVSGWLGLDGMPYKWITNEPIPTNSSIFKAIPKTVGNTYIKNFRFIDRAHNDIGVELLVNYRNAVNGLLDTATSKSLYSAMTDILFQNYMLFLPMPSYQSFDNIDDLVKIFEPIPFSESKMVTNEHDLDTAMYICMYSGRPSSRLDLGQNSPFSNDGYGLNERKDIPNDYVDGDSDTKVPAIAVNFGQQNQQYFKNFSLNMSNPNTTDASIMILKNLNNRANQNSTVEPIGQDMFSLYSQYSYTCDVEMMGCAQIQPMMYFQLANIPMWNGAYMIYKIKHSIKPGNMTTNFTGMRMAKTYPKLIKQNMLTFKLSGILGGNIDNLTAVNNGSPTKMISFNEKDKFRETDRAFISNYVDGNVNQIPENIYNRLKHYTSVMFERIYDSWSEYTNGEYELYVYSGYRRRGATDGESSTSVHPLGLAIDIHIRNQESNQPLNRKLQDVIKEMMINGLYIDQVLFEQNSGYWVHVGFADPSGQDVTIVDGRYKTRGQYFDMYKHEPTKEFKNKTKPVIQQAIWPNNNIVPTVKIEEFGKATNFNVQSVLSYFKNNTKLNNAQIAGIMGNIYQESKFIPTALSKKTAKEHSYGLVQWNSKYYPSMDSSIDDLKNAVGNTIQSQLNFLTTTDGYKNTFINKTKGSNSPEECAKIFCQFYEIPGDMEYQKQLRAGFARYYYNNVVLKY